MALKYTTVQNFWKFLGVNTSILSVGQSDADSGGTPARETIKATPVVAGDYWLNQPQANTDTLVLYVGSSNTQLTITTDYTVTRLQDAVKVTITADGATALTGEDLTSDYEYNGEKNLLNYDDTDALLTRMENRMEGACNTVFADQTATSPNYRQITNELDQGKGYNGNMYQVDWWPMVKLQTTVNGDYTTGDEEITLTSASGFPDSGTIYIGGNKVTYTGKAGNVLTIPSSTPSISDGATVRGEVVEISTSPDGVDPGFVVLDPDSDYAMDYDTGTAQIFSGSTSDAVDSYLTRPQDGVFDRVRASYNHAYHEPGLVASIPEDIVELVHMMAGRQLIQRTIIKSHTGQRDNFDPQNIGFSKKDINDTIQEYVVVRTKNV